MRRAYLLPIIASLFGLSLIAASTSARAANGLLSSLGNGHGQSCGCGHDECENGCDNGCGHRRHGHRRRMEGSDKLFNCGCNGSYKFPVPPLYTYHWPGLYSHQLMTDYHSPWRFPPVKPYAEEPQIESGAGGEAGAMLLSPVRPISNVVEIGQRTPPARPQSMSAAMRRLYR